jgi:uncharacterized repeat protein (TIGR03803 family)
MLGYLGGGTGVAAQTLAILHNFGGNGDGANSFAGLIADTAGNLYGTTEQGGASGGGTVFKLTPARSESVLYNFPGFPGDGAAPLAGLIADAAGNLYGTTFSGGANGFGAIFRLTPADGESLLYSFAGAPGDGANPLAGLITDTAGNLYGTTEQGGGDGFGTVFKLTPEGGESLLQSFAGFPGDGAAPLAGMIADTAGNLYGTTFSGGASGLGTVFKLTPEGAESVLYSFGGGDGALPRAGLILDTAGNLYGSTFSGGASGFGTVFKLTPTGSESILHSFAGAPGDGAFPYAGLIADAAGNLYGTTAQGGANGLGTVFKLTPMGNESVLHSFAGAPGDGANPFAGLIADAAGNLYGTTYYGGANDAGTVFEFAVFAGSPGSADCVGKSISALARTYGGIAKAAAALRFAGVAALHDAVAAYCRG